MSEQPTDPRPCAPPEPIAGNYFVSNYPPFSCWSEAGTADYRAALARPPADVPLGLYVHIPFCVDRCHYCYYLSHDDQRHDVDRYLDAVVAELGMLARTAACRGRRPEFVYFGGGTPSLLSTPRVERFLGAVQSLFPFDDAREITFECAPRSVTEPKLEALRSAGVTRISLGVQQLNDDVLRSNGRVHLVADVERAFAAIRSVGFDVVNLDLIAGLVDETELTFSRSLERVVELLPDSVTIYQLEIPLNTPLWRQLRDGEVGQELASWTVKRARVRAARERLQQAGYSLTSAYAAVRDPARHAFVYQQAQYHGADLVAAGASAFAHVSGCNHQNLVSVRDYLEHVENGRLPLHRGYALSATERAVRELVLQLKIGPIDRRVFAARHGVDPVELIDSAALSRSVAAGWMDVDTDRVTATPEGLLRVDRLLPEFYLQEHHDVRYS